LKQFKKWGHLLAVALHRQIQQSPIKGAIKTVGKALALKKTSFLKDKMLFIVFT
jgi:hypothetical protein